MATAAIRSYNIQKLEPFIEPNETSVLVGRFPNSTGFLAKGTLVGEITATPGTFAAYNNANSNGTETARGILMYDIFVDATGNVTPSPTPGADGGEWGEEMRGAPIYVRGFFKTTDLVGLDAAAVTDLGRLVQGSVADGILKIG